MKILYELVTVMSEQKPIDHWETRKFFSGKMADALNLRNAQRDIRGCVYMESYSVGLVCMQTFIDGMFYMRW